MTAATMECFITKDGAERKAVLEDLFPIIGKDRRMLQYILREANRSKINLAAALARLPGEMKELTYSNVSPRFSARLKKEISHAESEYNEYFLRLNKKKLIDHIGECTEHRIAYPKQIVWKETGPEKEKAAEPSPNPLEALVKRIEESFDTGKLKLIYYTDEITHDDVHRQLDGTFRNRLSELSKIKYLDINAKDLPAAALLFEKGKIEELRIEGEGDGAADEFAWPSFLENCQSLIRLNISYTGSELPSWIRTALSLRSLSISRSKIESLPDWVGDLRSLTDLLLYWNESLETLPDSVASLENLRRFVLTASNIKELPDWIGGLQFLTDLSLTLNRNLETLPCSIGNLKNLVELYLYYSPLRILPDSMGNLKDLRKIVFAGLPIEEIPDWLGGLQSLTELFLYHNKNLKTLPDSMGNLRNLTTLDIHRSPIEKLPDTIVNCTALEKVDISITRISSVPDFITSVKYFCANRSIDRILIPEKHSISHKAFQNSYYRLVETIFRYNKKARREGLLALEDELEVLADGFFNRGMRLVVDEVDPEIIRNILTIKVERENDHYRKKLMETATEGILCIQAGDNEVDIAFTLASCVNIENNPLDDACARYLSGDIDAFSNIDYEAAIQPEEEREEIRFIKRAVDFIKISHREGLFALEEHLDHEGIARRDVFDYGLVFVIDGWDFKIMEKVLDNLIERETDHIQKNLAKAKKGAVMSISRGDSPQALGEILCAHFDEGITGEAREFFDGM